MRSLAHPPLGLVLVLLALHQLPQQLGTLASLLLVPSGWIAEIGLIALVQVAASLAQIAAGWAIATRSASARGWFAGFAVCSVAYAAVAGWWVASEGESLAAVIAVVEAIGVPLVVAVVPYLLGGRELTGERTRGDAAAMMLVLAVAGILGTALSLYDLLPMLASSGASAGAWLGQLLWPLLSLSLATLGIVAAAHLARGPAARATRTLSAWAFSILIARAGLAVLVIGYTLLVENEPRATGYIIATQLIGLLTSVLPALFIWAYAKPALAADADVSTKLSPTLSWMALAFVPALLARVLLSDTHAPLWVSTAGVALGVALLAAGWTTLTEHPTARLLAALAALAALAMFAVAAASVFEHRAFKLQMLAPFTRFIALTGVLAWAVRARR